MRPAWTGLILMLILISSCASPAAYPQGGFHQQVSPIPVESHSYPLPATWTVPSPLQTLPQQDEVPAATALLTPTRPEVTVYQVQSGDTLQALVQRFQTPAEALKSDGTLSETGFLSPGQKLFIPGVAGAGEPKAPLLPDSEVVYSPSAATFDAQRSVQDAGGYLASHGEYLHSTGWNTAADIVSRVAREFSINPRLLLSLLEYECGCLRGPLRLDIDPDYLLGVPGYRNKGLYHQLEWAANRLSEGYYGWRSGALIEFQGTDGIMMRPSPGLNAGSVALAYYFVQKAASRSEGAVAWQPAIDPRSGLPALYLELFGDPWQRAAASGVLVPGGLAQPELELPFEPGVLWSYSSGPHTAWGTIGAQAALDFAPAVPISGCVQTDAWVVAMADGLVVRSELGVVVQDLYLSQAEEPIDGLEQTGWAVLYLHVEDRERVAKGTYLKAGDRIGHPSCEGGRANGTHVHVARKYNGEWMAADGPVPFVLSGWTAHAGEAPYKGTLTMGKATLVAHPNGSRQTQIMKSEDAP
jgi:LasA protease